MLRQPQWIRAFVGSARVSRRKGTGRLPRKSSSLSDPRYSRPTGGRDLLGRCPPAAPETRLEARGRPFAELVEVALGSRWPALGAEFDLEGPESTVIRRWRNHKG